MKDMLKNQPTKGKKQLTICKAEIMLVY